MPLGQRSETTDVSSTRTPAVTREHWLNTLVGILDSSFYLTYEEQFACTRILSTLLEKLNIPERGNPKYLPMPVVQEAYAHFYSTALESSLSGLPRPARPAGDDDCVTSLEAWRSALESMFTQAYPDLDGRERMLLAKVLHDLLAAIGIPDRAASHFPDSVIRAHREIDDN